VPQWKEFIIDLLIMCEKCINLCDQSDFAFDTQNKEKNLCTTHNFPQISGIGALEEKISPFSQRTTHLLICGILDVEITLFSI